MENKNILLLGVAGLGGYLLYKKFAGSSEEEVTTFGGDSDSMAFVGDTSGASYGAISGGEKASNVTDTSGTLRYPDINIYESNITDGQTKKENNLGYSGEIGYDALGQPMSIANLGNTTTKKESYKITAPNVIGGVFTSGGVLGENSVTGIGSGVSRTIKKSASKSTTAGRIISIISGGLF